MMPGGGEFIGGRVDHLPTPSLIVDIEALDRNLRALPALLSGTGIRLRAHAKAHKSAEIARRQIALGAVGICCQTVAEAEAFAAAGIADILLTNQIADAAKARRLASVPQDVRLGVCVDSQAGLELIASATPSRAWDIYVEVDVGGGRCGVTDPVAATALARNVTNLGLNFAGLQAYNGRIQHVPDLRKRQEAVMTTAAATRAYLDAFELEGLRCPIVTGGGTGTAAFDKACSTINEVQCGSYALMDADYLSLEMPAQSLFEPALTVLASVIAVAPGQAVLDAGLKALAFDSGMPLLRAFPGIAYCNASDEHGVIRAADGGALPSLGSRVELVPGHCDPTVALHRQIHAARAGVVEEVWPVLARGHW